MPRRWRSTIRSIRPMIDFIVQLNEQCYGMLNDTSRRMYRVARLQDDFPPCVYIKQGTRDFRSHQTTLIKRDEKFIRTESSARRARPIVREKSFALTVICPIMKNIMGEARGVIPLSPLESSVSGLRRLEESSQFHGIRIDYHKEKVGVDSLDLFKSALIFVFFI